MKRQLILSSLIAAVLAPVSFSHGQSFVGKAEGSRPGETYRAGESSRAGESTQRAQPQQQQPFQTQYPDNPQYQMDPALAPQQRQAQTENKSSAGSSKLVIMEFSDLQCPDSARYNSDLKNTILQRYVTSGKASYEWHDFPLPSHSSAPEAAAAARCAGASADRMRQQIMSNQGQMSASVYLNYARAMGVSADKFGTCLRDGARMKEVMNDQALGKSLGVRGTPTLVLGTAGSDGRVKPVKVVKAYDPPQQVLGEIDSFVASSSSRGQSERRY